MQRPNPIRVPDHAGKSIHVLLKSQRALTLVPQLHLGLPRAKPEAPELLDSQSRLLRPSDSVVLMRTLESKDTSNSMILVPLLNPKFAIRLAAMVVRTSGSRH